MRPTLPRNRADIPTHPPPPETQGRGVPVRLRPSPSAQEANATPPGAQEATADPTGRRGGDRRPPDRPPATSQLGSVGGCQPSACDTTSRNGGRSAGVRRGEAVYSRRIPARGTPAPRPYRHSGPMGVPFVPPPPGSTAGGCRTSGKPVSPPTRGGWYKRGAPLHWPDARYFFRRIFANYGACGR
jgi:hypothetical protein